MALSYALTLCKPDAVRLGLVGEIIRRFEARGLTLLDMKMKVPEPDLIRKMYFDKQTYGFFDELLKFMTSGPVVACAWQGEEASARCRQVIGEKDPLDSQAGTIRGELASEDKVRCLVHGSRTPEEAYQELMLWFPERWEGTPTPAIDRPTEDTPYAPGEMAAPASGYPALMRPWEDQEEASALW
jgi:nucleoside-diphosphate kinase